jgi:hypothetical protein
MKSIFGRPRVVTDAQVAAVMDWYTSRKSLRQVAAEAGISLKLAQDVIRRRGQYKQTSPELRQTTLRARRKRMKALSAGGWL